MKLAIMQPYFFPYLGYFQLINAVDAFVIYDNIEYTKKGWINRNRMLMNGKDQLFTVPLKKDRDDLSVNQRHLSDDASQHIQKILRQVQMAYSKAPYFSDVLPLLKSAFLQVETNLFNYIYNGIKMINSYLEINTPLIISSSVPVDHALKGKAKVISLCKKLGAQDYINPIGGMALYDKTEFDQQGIRLQFHKMNDVSYPQGGHEFIKSLSILDVMMFNSQAQLKYLLSQYTLI